MITGRKNVVAARDAYAVPRVRAALVLLLLAFLAGIMVGLTRLPPPVPHAAQVGPQGLLRGEVKKLNLFH